MSRAARWASPGQNILLTLWVGGLWTAGYIVTPMLFSVLDDRRLAGELAGRMFTLIGYIGLFCGAALLISLIYQAGRYWRRTWQIWVLMAMLLLVIAGQFLVQPMIQELKAGSPAGFIEGSAEAGRFGALHGVASMLYLGTSLLGLGLVSFGLGRRYAD